MVMDSSEDVKDGGRSGMDGIVNFDSTGAQKA